MTPGTAAPVFGVTWATSAMSGLLLATCAGVFWASGSGALAGRGDFNGMSAEAAVRERAAAEAEHIAFTTRHQRVRSVEIEIQSGESMAAALMRAGVARADMNAAIASLNGVYDPRRVRPGQAVTLSYAAGDDAAARFAGLSFRSQPGAGVTVTRMADAGFIAREVQMPVTYEIARVAASVETSIFEAAVAQGATDKEVAALAEVFGYDVDFQRDIRRGDRFEIVFERFFDEAGDTVRTGDLVYLSLTAQGRERGFYRYQAPGDDRPEWYDADGKSARKFLMKTPINGARLSSTFGMRRHPVLGYSRMHRGADFAAPPGTPIMAAGDGVVVRAGRNGGYGNYVRIRHGDQYETAYAHMRGFARGVRAGTRVRQGQVIGYVGSTGISTGPHLHYEVIHRGRQVNPMGLSVPTGRNLDGGELDAFFVERDRIDRLRAAREAQTQAAAGVQRPRG